MNLYKHKQQAYQSLFLKNTFSENAAFWCDVKPS